MQARGGGAGEAGDVVVAFVRAADVGVFSVPAAQPVVADAAVESVAFGATDEDVVAGAAVERVESEVAEDAVVARLAVELVSGAVAVDRVVAFERADDVLFAFGEDRVGAGAADDEVRSGGSGDRAGAPNHPAPIEGRAVSRQSSGAGPGFFGGERSRR